MTARIEWLPRLVTYTQKFTSAKQQKYDLFISQVLSP